MDALAGKVALVTGSSSGIGAEVARVLAAEGATVVVNSSSSVEAGEAVAKEVGGSYVQADVSDQESAKALVTTTVERHGRLDVLINNAGTTFVIPHADLDAVKPEHWHKILDVNVLGTWFVTLAAVPHLKATGDGSVVNVTSVAGVRPTGSSIPYAVSKAALNHLTLLLANVLGPEVRVNAVAPGLVDTPWTADWDAIRASVEATAPLRRSGQPEDIAAAVLGIVLARYATGQVLVVDGGISLR
jgi:ketoreductase RED2